MIKKCIVCNEDFNAKVHNQYYCSDKCKTQDLTRLCKECGKEFQVPKKSSLHTIHFFIIIKTPFVFFIICN